MVQGRDEGRTEDAGVAGPPERRAEDGIEHKGGENMPSPVKAARRRACTGAMSGAHMFEQIGFHRLQGRAISTS